MNNPLYLPWRVERQDSHERILGIVMPKFVSNWRVADSAGRLAPVAGLCYTHDDQYPEEEWHPEVGDMRTMVRLINHFGGFALGATP